MTLPTKLRTTIAGSLPKPSWLAEPNRLWAPWRLEGDALAEGKRDAVRLVLRDQDNAKKLSTGEIDLWATGDPAGRYLARQIGMTAFKTVLRFNGTQLYLALNKSVPDEVVKKLQESLDQMREDGFVDATFSRYL